MNILDANFQPVEITFEDSEALSALLDDVYSMISDMAADDEWKVLILARLTALLVETRRTAFFQGLDTAADFLGGTVSAEAVQAQALT